MRTAHSVVGATNVVSIESLTNDYRTDRGILKNDPGLTVGPIRGRIGFSPSALPGAGAVDQLRLGIIVAPDTIDSADLTVLSNLHLYWMWLDRFSWGNISGAAGFPFQFEVSTKSRRRLAQVGQDLWLVIDPAMTGALTLTVDFQLSVLALLP